MRAAVVLVVLALLASGCTDDPEDPAPTATIGPSPVEETRGTGSVPAPPPASTEAEVLDRVRRGVEAARAGEPIPDATAPSVRDLKTDYSTGGPDCAAFYRSNDGDWQLCARGDVDGDRTMVVIGDSHARQWGSPLDILAERAGYAAYHLVRLGCPAADLTPWLNKGDGPNVVCEQFHAWTEEQVRALRPDVVVLATSFNPNGYVVDGVQVLDEAERLRLLREGMARLVDRLSAVRRPLRRHRRPAGGPAEPGQVPAAAAGRPSGTARRRARRCRVAAIRGRPRRGGRRRGGVHLDGRVVLPRRLLPDGAR